MHYVFRVAMHKMSLRRSLPGCRESGSAVAEVARVLVVFGLCGYAMPLLDSMPLCIASVCILAQDVGVAGP